MSYITTTYAIELLEKERNKLEGNMEIYHKYRQLFDQDVWKGKVQNAEIKILVIDKSIALLKQ